MAGGFDPKAYLETAEGGGAGGFDPRAYLAEGDHGMEEANLAAPAQAALEHFGNAAAMGYLPHLQAMVGKLMPNPSAGVDAELAAKGFKINPNQSAFASLISGQPAKPSDDSYLALRDANIARIAREGEEHPIASGVGTVAGVLASGAAMGGMGGARAATAWGRILQGVKTGAMMGALQNPGDTEGEIDPLQLGERYGNAKTGALMGGAIQGTIEASPYIVKFLKGAATKLGSAISGRTDDEIGHLAKRYDIIKELGEKTGGDMTQAADQVRQEISQGIQKTKRELGSQINKALESAPTEKSIDLDPILAPLQKQQAALLAKNQPEEAAQIGSIMNKLKSFGMDRDATYGVPTYTGKVNAKELNNIKGLLQDIAAPAYQQNGQIFNYAKSSQQAAKYAGGVARRVLNDSVEGISEPNNRLAAMHLIEGNLNRNLLAAGKPDSALFAAASGANPRNQAMLTKLGELSGVDAITRAKDLNAARTFTNPSLLPSDATGKTVARQAIAKAIGTAVGGGIGLLAGHGVGAAAGAAAGNTLAGALASPATIKAAIRAGNFAAPAVNAAGRAIANNPAMVQRVAQSVVMPTQNREAQGSGLDEDTLGVFRSNPALIDSLANPKLKAAIQKEIGRTPSAAQPAQMPAPDRWAAEGAKSLGLQDSDAQALMQSPSGKKLLMRASDLKPGSQAMKSINDQIQKLLKGAE